MKPATTSASSGRGPLGGSARLRQWCSAPARRPRDRAPQHLLPARALPGSPSEKAVRKGTDRTRCRASRVFAVLPGARAVGRQSHEEWQLARTGAVVLVGNGRVVGGQTRRRARPMHGGSLDEEARREGDELLGHALVVEQRLFHHHRPSPIRGTGQARRPASEASAVCSAVLAATMRRAALGSRAPGPQPDGPTPVLHHQRDPDSSPSSSVNRASPIDVGLARCGRCGRPACPSARSRSSRVRPPGGRGRPALGSPCGRDRTRWAGRAGAAPSPPARSGPRRRSACAVRRAGSRSAARRGTRVGRRSGLGCTQ